jgi:hypothetical protein
VIFKVVAMSATGEMTVLDLPRCDTEMMNLFLHTLSCQFAAACRAVTRLGRLAPQRLNGGPDNVHWLYQPAHNPELNPVEHL